MSNNAHTAKMRFADEINSKLFRYAAAYYLDWWLTEDKKVVEAL